MQTVRYFLSVLGSILLTSKILYYFSASLSFVRSQFRLGVAPRCCDAVVQLPDYAFDFVWVRLTLRILKERHVALAFTTLFIEECAVSMVLLRLGQIAKSWCQLRLHTRGLNWFQRPVSVLDVEYLLMHASSKSRLATVELSSRLHVAIVILAQISRGIFVVYFTLHLPECPAKTPFRFRLQPYYLWHSRPVMLLVLYSVEVF